MTGEKSIIIVMGGWVVVGEGGIFRWGGWRGTVILHIGIEAIISGKITSLSLYFDI